MFTELRDQREVVAGTLFPGSFPNATSTSVKLVFSEPGIADLSRLCVFAFENDDIIANQTQQDVMSILRISAIYVRSSVEKVRGNLVGPGIELAVPGGVFSPLRKYSPIQLGPVAVGVGDSVQIQAKVDALGGGNPFDGQLGFAVPFQPDSLRDLPPVLVDDVDGWHYVASAPVDIAAGDGTGIPLFFDTDGILDLTNLQICATADPTLNYPQNVIAGCRVGIVLLPCFCSATRSLSMLNDMEAVPAAMFSHTGRSRPWANLGQLQVRNRQGLVVEVSVPNATVAPPTVTVTVGAPFYPLDHSAHRLPPVKPDTPSRPLLQPSGAVDEPVDSSAGPVDTDSGAAAPTDATGAESSAAES